MPRIPAPTLDDLARPTLLQRQAHQVTLTPASHDFQLRVGRPFGTPRRGVTPCAVVLTRSADREIDELSLHLAARGIPLVRFDSDRCPGDQVSWDLADDVLRTDEGVYRPAVCWVRYFTPSSMPLPTDAQVAAYARDQWQPWSAALLAAGGAHAVNAGAGPGQPDRVGQLAAARALGLRTPATVVTTVPGQAVGRIPGHGDLVVKSLGEHFVEPIPGRLTGLAPRRLTRAALLANTATEPAPVLVQEFLPSRRELRIYAVGGRLLTFAVTRPTPEALWTQPERVAARRIPTPEALRQPLRALVARWQLDVAAFDVLDTDRGHIFLEVNSACDWLWCESLAGTAAVSTAVRKRMAELFEHTTTRSAR